MLFGLGILVYSVYFPKCAIKNVKYVLTSYNTLFVFKNA